jgi:hypothetical protein
MHAAEVRGAVFADLEAVCMLPLSGCGQIYSIADPPLCQGLYSRTAKSPSVSV